MTDQDEVVIAACATILARHWLKPPFELSPLGIRFCAEALDIWLTREQRRYDLTVAFSKMSVSGGP
jgi:hypothetical protein